MKAVICGAGIAGLALAKQLASHHWDVTVVEKSPRQQEQGYMVDFFGPGYDAAAAMGVLPRLQELSYDIDGFVYVNDKGKPSASLNFSKIQKAANGRLLSIMRPSIESALHETLDDSVDLRFATTITEIENTTSGVRTTLSDGTSIDADLLVGADGIHSAVRAKVFGPEENYLRYLGYHTAAYTFRDDVLYRELNSRFCLTETLNRQIGLYGLRDGSVAVFAVHRRADPALPADPRAELHDVYSTLGWVAPKVLEHCPQPDELYYDQVAQIEIPEWTHQRVTLLGDSCQAVSLLAGQGASLAIAGAHLLGEQLATARSVDEALAEYQRQWSPVVRQTQRVARTGAQWFLPDTMTRLRVRRVALKLVNRFRLDRLLIRPVKGHARTDSTEGFTTRTVKSQR